MSTTLEQLSQIEAATRVRLSAIYEEIASLRASDGFRSANETTLARLATLKERRTTLDKEISKISNTKEYLCRVKSEEESIWAISDSLTSLEELRKFYMTFDIS